MKDYLKVKLRMKGRLQGTTKGFAKEAWWRQLLGSHRRPSAHLTRPGTCTGGSSMSSPSLGPSQQLSPPQSNSLTALGARTSTVANRGKIQNNSFRGSFFSDRGAQFFHISLRGKLQKWFEDYGYRRNWCLVKKAWILESDIFGFKLWPYLLGRGNCLLWTWVSLLLKWR